jgi:hypothetical protein
MSKGYSLALLSLSLPSLPLSLSIYVNDIYRDAKHMSVHARPETLDRHRAAGTMRTERSDVHLIGGRPRHSGDVTSRPPNAARAYMEANQADDVRTGSLNEIWLANCLNRQPLQPKRT